MKFIALETQVILFPLLRSSKDFSRGFLKIESLVEKLLFPQRCVCENLILVEKWLLFSEVCKTLGLVDFSPVRLA